MKPKRSAFANSSTGYGKSKHNRDNKAASKATKNDIKAAKDSKKEKKIEEAIDKEKDLNSGFGDYLRTPEAVEMMKLFVFANTVMLIITMAWPHFKEQYIMLMQWLASFRDD